MFSGKRNVLLKNVHIVAHILRSPLIIHMGQLISFVKSVGSISRKETEMYTIYLAHLDTHNVCQIEVHAPSYGIAAIMAGRLLGPEYVVIER